MKAKQTNKKPQGFQMTGADIHSMRPSTKLPLLAIPTEDCFHEGHQIFRHLPSIREGMLDITHGSRALRKLRQETENAEQ